ncbi:hypothetical protein JIN84_07240 [Luteolibacter yonseiensis]|uniref:SLA1 homology domain-containing protein n=1 Tax=Luteolibacter yonseiensis TaxID=1144680 RepID=A0A934R327_9BACT|nr:SHD1 domain-containing protein [Luteolibacter yonseiensis]MBK1815401.1 hypothetical protein [Luteolibacter yonseiensis]
MRFLPISLLLLGLCHAAEVRTWTDAQSRKIEATLVRIEGTSVVLKLADGREAPFPLDKLSEPDRKYVEDNRALTPTTKELKPATKVETESPDASKKLNFDDPWPESIRFTEDPEISTIEENAEKKHFIYESANYRYVCDVRLAKSVVKGFAVMFEATHLFCRTMPLAINGGVKKDGKHQILLFEKFDDYVKAGGPPTSAGVYIGGKGVVMVPLGSLGVKPVGSGYMLDRDKSSKTLPHELTHQLTPDPYYDKGSMGWFTEGIAEYVAVTPYRSGSYSVRGNQKDIFDYATGYGSKDMGGRALGTKIHLPPLKDFMLQSYSSFLEQPQLSYGCGLLITTYFLHMDGAGDGKRIKAFLKALHEGKDGEASLSLLLDGRTFEELQNDLIKAWSRKGVDFTFGK